MPCKIHLRHDQSSSDIPSSQRKGIVVFAPSWVKSALTKLGERLEGTTFQVLDRDGETVLDTFTLTPDISLQQLQIITRLLPTTVTGDGAQGRGQVVRGIEHYAPDLQDISLIIAMKDLVRQCVIIGLGKTTHYGGYGGHPRTKQRSKVIICDLIGLEFSRVNQTGRLVLIPQTEGHDSDRGVIPVGFLDNLIYENVVGEEIPSYETAVEDKTGRFEVAPTFHGIPVYFDSFAYKRFVSQDVVLTGLGLIAIATQAGYNYVHFKFLKYGSGYFAGWYRKLIEKYILSGVVDGLEALFKRLGTNSVIKHVEFPYFSKDDQNSLERLDRIEKTFGVSYSFTRDDALEAPSGLSKLKKGDKAIFATTNCADPHAAIGNEMGFGSVDAAIAENLERKGNIFCPCLNKLIQGRFIDL